MQRFSFSLLLVLTLSACGFEAGPPRNIEIAGAQSFSDVDAKVVGARLESYTAQGLLRQAPTYVFELAGQVVRVRASSAPADTHIQFLLSHQGLFEVMSEGGVPWFNQGHVVDAAVGFNSQERKVLHLRLNEEGTSRLARLSSANVPTLVSVRLDGQTLATARLTTPITQGRLEVTVDKPVDELLLIVELIKSGPLSFSPSAVNIRPPSPERT